MAAWKQPGGKVPKTAVTPNPKKLPKTAEDAVNSEGKHPVFRFHHMDLDGTWGWSHLNAATYRKLHGHLVALESMTWADIGKRHNTHYITHGMCQDAIGRLVALKLDDSMDQVYAIALGNKPRLFGIRKGREFCLLWWDPEHQVCPSDKKS